MARKQIIFDNGRLVDHWGESLTLSPPALFTHQTTEVPIPPGESFTWEIPLPAPRLFGIIVELLGLSFSEDETVTVSLLDASTSEEPQYVANFTGMMSIDDSQGWRFRSDLTPTLFIKAENTSEMELSVSVRIVLEPF